MQGPRANACLNIHAHVCNCTLCAGTLTEIPLSETCDLLTVCVAEKNPQLQEAQLLKSLEYIHNTNEVPTDGAPTPKFPGACELLGTVSLGASSLTRHLECDSPMLLQARFGLETCNEN